ncbi:MAG: hypothetical protein EBT98_12870 [Opitutaceae bacterium]|nr:hypothetical protein [Opitutaceae bacterium]
MKSFKDLRKKLKNPTGDLKDACWKGYVAVGMKEKGGKKVPNCVPVKEGVYAETNKNSHNEFLDTESTKD